MRLRFVTGAAEAFALIIFKLSAFECPWVALSLFRTIRSTHKDTC